MTTRNQPFSEEFLAMSPQEKVDYLKQSRVADRSELPEADRARSEAMLEEARSNLHVRKKLAAG